MMKWILWGSIFWLPILLYFMLANETKFKKNLVLGVTLPLQAREDGEVQVLIRRFLFWLRLTCIALVILAALCALLIPGSAAMAGWCLWIDLAIVLPYVPYVLIRRRLLDLKQRKGWGQPRRTAVVDTAAISADRWLSPWLFVPAVAVSLIPLCFDRNMAVMYVSFAAMCLLCWLGYRWLYRNRAEMVDDNTDLTAALSRIRKYNWGKMWLLTACFLALCSVGCWLMAVKFWLGTAAILLISVVLCVAAFRIEFRTRRLQEKLTRDSGAGWYVDEDERWIGGILYCNPDDSRTIVNARIGINSTVNVAHWPGKILMICTALILIAMPFFGVFMDRLGEQEIDIQITGGVLEAEAGMTDYAIELDEIEEAELLDSLPDNLRRVAGTGMEHLLKGRFTSDRTGRVQVLLDPTVPPYLLLRTQDGAWYLLGTRDPAATRALYESLPAHTGG